MIETRPAQNPPAFMGAGELAAPVRPMRRLALIAALALAGCHSYGDRARGEYEIAERYGSQADLCEAATRAAAGYLRDGDEEGFRDWSIMRDLECARADL
jgi:hypothetical protein